MTAINYQNNYLSEKIGQSCIMALENKIFFSDILYHFVSYNIYLKLIHKIIQRMLKCTNDMAK